VSSAIEGRRCGGREDLAATSSCKVGSQRPPKRSARDRAAPPAGRDRLQPAPSARRGGDPLPHWSAGAGREMDSLCHITALHRPLPRFRRSTRHLGSEEGVRRGDCPDGRQRSP